jgi:hypothetical protein
MKALVVKNPFGGHERGTVITDPEAVAEILAGEHAPHVTVTELGDTPAEAPVEPAKKKSK